MALRWSDQKRCPKCHRTVPKDQRRCVEHSIDPYWISVTDVAPAGARRRRKQVGTSATKRRSDLDPLKADVEALFDASGVFQEPSTETLGVYLERWHAGRQSHLASRTWDGEGWLLNKHVLGSQIAEVRLSSIDRPMMRNYLQTLSNELSAKSVRNIIGTIRRAFTDAIDDGLYVGPNPASKVAPPNRPKHRDLAVWDSGELSLFLDAVDDPAFAILYRTLATTGLRRNEALALRWSDIDLDTQRISITRSVDRVTGGVPSFKTPKTRAGVRQVPLTNSTSSALREWRRTQLTQRMAAGSGWSNHDGLVFTDALGHLLRPDRVSRVFARTVQDLDVTTIRLHDLRHTAASHLLSSGVSLFVVSRVLGHASIAITSDVYGHLVGDSLDEVAEALERRLG